MIDKDCDTIEKGNFVMIRKINVIHIMIFQCFEYFMEMIRKGDQLCVSM